MEIVESSLSRRCAEKNRENRQRWTCGAYIQAGLFVLNVGEITACFIVIGMIQ